MVFFHQFLVTFFQIKSVYLRTKHTDILHNKSFRLKFYNRSYILFYKHIIHTDCMVLLSVCIRKSLTRRTSDNNIYFSIFFSYFIIISGTYIPLHINSWMISSVCLLHIFIIFKRNFYIVLLCLHKA